MRFADEPSGLKDRNAASINGIFELLTGGDPSIPKSKRVKIAWGLNRYYEQGVMEITFMSYTKMGTYQSCNAVNPGQPGSPHHCSDCAPAQLSGQCCCASWNSTSLPLDAGSLSGAALPGRLKNSYTGGVWYSFNGQGLGSTWHQFECPSATVSMKKLADKLADVGNCGKCRASTPTYGSYFHKCGECIRKIPEHTWQKAFHSLFPSGIFGSDKWTQMSRRPHRVRSVCEVLICNLLCTSAFGWLAVVAVLVSAILVQRRAQCVMMEPFPTAFFFDALEG